MQVALRGLQEHLRLPAGVTAESIVEGHREKTLALLWAIIFHFKVGKYNVHSLVPGLSLKSYKTKQNRMAAFLCHLPVTPLQHTVYGTDRH